MSHLTYSNFSKYVVLLFCLICSIAATAQTRYKVVTDSQVNVRVSPSTNAPIVGTLKDGSEINVLDLSNGWAKIKYGHRYSYVSAQFLQERPDSSKEGTVKNGNEEFQETERLSTKWAACIIVGLICLQMFTIITGYGSSFRKWFYINLAILLIISMCELIYITQCPYSDVIWFCKPGEVGWIWTIVNSFLFIYLWSCQGMGFYGLIMNISDSNRDFDLILSIISSAIGSIASILAVTFFPHILMYVVVAYLACQFIQNIIMCRAIVPIRGWGEAIICFIVYLSVSTVEFALTYYLLILLKFLIPYIITLIALLFIDYCIVQGGGNPRRLKPANSEESIKRDSCLTCDRLTGCTIHDKNDYDYDLHVCDYYKRRKNC